jgi:hypothetical protein
MFGTLGDLLIDSKMTLDASPGESTTNPYAKNMAITIEKLLILAMGFKAK